MSKTVDYEDRVMDDLYREPEQVRVIEYDVKLTFRGEIKIPTDKYDHYLDNPEELDNLILSESLFDVEINPTLESEVEWS